MLRRQADVRANRIVWRMTAADSVSIDIDLTAPMSETDAPLDGPDHGWLVSSYELRHGLDVCEWPMDKLPDDLFMAFAESRR